MAKNNILKVRIADDYRDGDILTASGLNRIIRVLRDGINANFGDFNTIVFNDPNVEHYYGSSMDDQDGENGDYAGLYNLEEGTFEVYRKEAGVWNLIYDNISIINMFEDKLNRDGSQPMLDDLDMGDNNIKNVADGVALKDAVNKGQLNLKLDESLYNSDKLIIDNELLRLEDDKADITYVDNEDANTLQEAKDYTYSKSTIDNKDANTLQEAKDYTYSQVEIDNKDTVIMNKANDLENDKVDKTTTIIGLDLQDNILIGEFRTALGKATQSVAGLLSAEDKTHLDGLVALLETSDGNNVVDTIGEILEIFQNYPEGADLVTVLQGKVDKVIGKGLSTNDLTDTLKDHYDTAYAHSQIVGANPHGVTSHNIGFNGSGTNYLTAKTEVYSAVKELDTRVKTNADDIALKGSTNDFTDFYKAKLDEMIYFMGFSYIDGETFLTTPTVDVDGGDFIGFEPVAIIDGGAFNWSVNPLELIGSLCWTGICTGALETDLIDALCWTGTCENASSSNLVLSLQWT